MWLWTPACVLHWGRYKPRSIAVQTNGRDVYYENLAEDISATASAIHSLGLSGQRVAVICDQKLNFVTSLLGLQLGGCSVVLSNPQLPIEQLVTTVEDASPTALLTDFDVKGSRIIDAFEAVPNFRVDELMGTHSVSTPGLLDGTSWAQPSLKDEWGVLFTSGSTGAPKAILHDHYSMMTESLAWILELELRKSVSFYIARPVYYTGGLVLMMAVLSVGGTAILDDYADSNNPEELVQNLGSAVNKRRVDWCFFVPEQVRQILKTNQQWDTPGSPASILVMGSPISATEKRTVRDYFTARVIESWGNSEGLGTITEEEDIELRPESIGRPFVSESVFIVDEDANVCAPGIPGRLAGSDDTMFTEYLNRPEATSRTKNHSQVISDDVGYRDADGYFYIIGRAHDIVTIRGQTVILSDIEARLRTMDEVREVCVGAVVDGADVRLLALVEFRRDMTADDADVIKLETLNELLNEPQKLDRIIITDAIPKLASGKLDQVTARDRITREFEGG